MQNKHQEKYTLDKSRRESNQPGGSVSSTLGGDVRFNINGTILSQEEFFKLHINGFK